MAYLEIFAGEECDDVGCHKPVYYGLFNKDGLLGGRLCRTCGHRRLKLLGKIELRPKPRRVMEDVEKPRGKLEFIKLAAVDTFYGCRACRSETKDLMDGHESTCSVPWMVWLESRVWELERR